MKTVYHFCFALVFFSCSQTEETDPLTSRWAFAATDDPTLKKIAAGYSDGYGVNGFKQVFASSKFIFHPDHSFDLVLFQNYRHGSWRRDGNTLVLKVEPGQDSLELYIDTLKSTRLSLRTDSANFNKFGRMGLPFYYIRLFDGRSSIRFSLRRETENYGDTTKDPYHRAHNWWRIKPLQPETPERIKQRVLNLVDFHMLMFEDAIQKRKKQVLYNWFSSPLVVANNGLGLQHYSKIREDWEDCFYDSAQARQGYELLSSGFKPRLEFPDKGEDPFIRSIGMLKVFRKRLE